MSDTDNNMIGAGGGGGKAGKYTNKPDNLRSNDSFEILLGLGSGRWKGLTNGLKSLYINDVPMENEDGTTNFPGITALFADGNPLEKQLVNFQLGGGGGITSVNTQVGNLNTTGPGPWINASTSTPGATFIDFRFIVNQLVHQKKNGLFNAAANLEIEMRPVGTSTWINPLQAATAAPTTWNPTTGSYTYTDTLRDNSGVIETANYRTYVSRSSITGSSGSYAWADVVGSNTAGTNGKLTLTGKTTSPFVKEVRISVPNTGSYLNKTWEVRVRLTEKAQQYFNPNTENQEEVNRNITFESVTAVTKESFGSADSWRGLVWMQIGGKASDQLNGFPALKGIYDTKVVKVPPSAVFNPTTRQYTATLWDGTYALEYTNDPAWCIKDLIEDPISGVAALSPGATLDKWDALECSKYCSELVSDGKGGTHPRFSMNFRTENQLDTEELINYMAGAFSALAVDTGNGKWRLRMDKPETPVATYTMDNILGEFQYSHTDMDTRYNDITLSFLNADNKYEEDRVRVFDQANINLFGRKPTTIVAVGADSRQEALRRGMLRLRASLNEKKIVKFITNRQGRLLEPLQTILVADQSLGYMPPTNSGVLADTDSTDNRTTSRIISMDGARTTITLGRSIRLEPTVTYQISLTVPNPNYTPDTTTQPSSTDWNKPTIAITRTLTNTLAQRGDVTVLYLDSALPANVPINAVVALSAPGLPSLPVQYRVIEVSPGEDEKTTISAINVDTGKYAAADTVASNEVSAWQQTGATGTLGTPSVPTWGMFTLTSFPNNGVTQRLLTVNWDRPSSMFLEGYKVERRISSDIWVTETAMTNMNYFEVMDPAPGVWEWRISAKDRRGAWSAPLIGLIEVPAIELASQPLSSAGTLANRPSTNLEVGQQYTAIDQIPISTYRWDGSTWVLIATAGASVGSTLFGPGNVVLTAAQVITNMGVAAAIDNQAPTATSSDFSVITGVTRPADNATSDLALYDPNTVNYNVRGNTVTRNTPGSWVGNFYSRDRIIGGSSVSARFPTSEGMIGLSIDREVDNTNGYTRLDYAMHYSGGLIYVWENGAQYNPNLAFSQNDRGTVTYDGLRVLYAKNGAVFRITYAGPNIAFFVGGTLGTNGAWLDQIVFNTAPEVANVATNVYDNTTGSAVQVPRTNLVTSLGVASAITNQASWATYSGLTPVNVAGQVQYLSTSGTLDGLNHVTDRRMTYLYRADGTTSLTEAMAITSLGVASAIDNQGNMAVANMTYATVDGAHRLNPYSIYNSTTSSYLGDRWAAEGGANITETRISSGIYGQTQWATETRTPASVFNPAANRLYDGGFKLRGQGWLIGTGWVWSGADTHRDGPLFLNTGNNTGLLQSPFMKTSPGDPVTLQLEYYTQGLSAGNLRIDLTYYNSSFGAINEVISIQPPLSTNWTKVFSTATVPVNAVYLRVLVYLYNSPTNTGSGVRKMKVTNGTIETPFSDEATDGARLDNTNGRIRDPIAYNTQLLLGAGSTTNLSPSYSNNNGSTVLVTLPAHTRKVAGPTGPITLSYGAVSATVAVSTYWTAYIDDPELTGFASPTAVFTSNPDDLLYPSRYQIASGITPNSSNTGGSTGSGGGDTMFPDCVASDSFMPLGIYASDVKVGDFIKVLNEETWDRGAISKVTNNKEADAPCVRLTSETGITLVLSKSTPCTLRGGEVVDAADVLGYKLAVEDAGGFRWEEIVDVEDVGMRKVAHISCDNGTYAAGEKYGRYIYTHNIYYKP